MPEEIGRAGGPSQQSDAVPDGPPSSNELRRNRRNRGRRAGFQQTRFTGVCEDLKDHVYDTGVGRNNAEIFSKTTKAIAEYVAREYTAAGEFRNGLPDMTLPTLVAPTPPGTTATVVELKIWEMDLKEYRKRMEERERRTWRRPMHSSWDNAQKQFATGSRHTSNVNQSTLHPTHWGFYV